MSQQPRNSRTFKLEPEQVKQAHTGADETPIPPALEPYSQIEGSAPLLPKPLKRVLISLSLLLGVVITADILSLVSQLNQIHWLIGSAVGTALAGLAIYAGVGLYRWVRGNRALEQMEAVRAKAIQIRAHTSQGQKQILINALLNYYASKPQEGALRAALEKLPDYSSDQEAVEHIERNFLAPLDNQADKLIQRYSLQTGLSVAASPFPILDILLTLWRCQILISEISELYGIQPSLANRFRILIRVLRAMAYSGLTETSMGLADLSNIPLGQFGARTAQGLGAAVACARLGLVTARLSRPIPSQSDEKSVFKKLASAILLLLGRKILGRH